MREECLMEGYLCGRKFKSWGGEVEKEVREKGDDVEGGVLGVEEMMEG